MKVHDEQGTEIADIALSEKQQDLLAAGEEITVIYHTPQLLRHLLGDHSGAFSLRKNGDNAVTNTRDALREFAELQKAVKTAQGRN